MGPGSCFPRGASRRSSLPGSSLGASGPDSSSNLQKTSAAKRLARELEEQGTDEPVDPGRGSWIRHLRDRPRKSAADPLDLACAQPDGLTRARAADPLACVP